MKPSADVSPRQVALGVLQAIQRGAFADISLDQGFQRSSLEDRDRRFITELVYGILRRQRTLDALIDQLATKATHQQPPKLRLILQIGLYQLRYLTHVPAAAAVTTTVDLAKHNGFPGLTGFVNGLLRRYVRLMAQTADPLQLPEDQVQALAILHSYPDWMVQEWRSHLSWDDTAALCAWFNQPPTIDLRINPLKVSLEGAIAAFQAVGIACHPMPNLPQALRLQDHSGDIRQFPGYAEGWWSVQDSSAQLVGHLVNPQPEEVIVDACAAPGGKTTHLAELMGDRGVIWACDRSAHRLKRLTQNQQRLGLQSIRLCTQDSLEITQWTEQADAVLLDAPCSGLGTLHRHADARWRQTPTTVAELAVLQRNLLRHTATWVKPGGRLIYSTCTLHPAENEAVVTAFLQEQPDWTIQPIPEPYAHLQGDERTPSPSLGLRIWPHRTQMDGFFVAVLQRAAAL
jgi:16S rRNA (cytosine967-C5)-methyltransferase